MVECRLARWSSQHKYNTNTKETQMTAKQTERKPGEKKSRDAMLREDIPTLCNNAKKAIRFDTGGVSHVNALKAYAKKKGFEMGDLSAGAMALYFDEKLEKIREAVYERLDVVIEKSTNASKEVLP
jgi:hypothetical protein